MQTYTSTPRLHGGPRTSWHKHKNIAGRLGLGERRGTEWTSLQIWEARDRRCQPRRAAPALDEAVRSLCAWAKLPALAASRGGRIWEARGRRCQPRRAAPALDDVVRSLSRGAGAVEAAPGASCSRAAREVAAAPGHAATVPQPGRAGTALPGRQATDLAGGARDPGLLRWICWRREEERERGSAAAGSEADWRREKGGSGFG